MTKTQIKTVVASAGAGKTTRIVNDITDEVMRREPEELVATTFTVKAADELIERSRANLFRTGQAEKAARLLGARFGTVNSVCGQIVAENAISLGRSPRADVIPEQGRSRLFAVAADAAIERHAPELNRLADAFGLNEPKWGGDDEKSDWRTLVRQLIELARANGLASAQLSRSAEKSFSSFLPMLLPPAAEGVDGLNATLLEALNSACTTAPAEPSATAKPSLQLVRRIRSALQHKDSVSWPEWVRLSKIKYAKTKDGPAFCEAMDKVCQAASRHPEHPDLHDDCGRFIRTLFECAAEALESYQHYKHERGLLDFIDQEALALEVLQNPETAKALSEKISSVFVDEFQDSSPIQIAIFTALAGLVESSTWVGDPKQAIYGFRNADSDLTQAAFAGAAAMAMAPSDVLSCSYRSREGIIGLVNEGFGPVFESMGLPASQHAFSHTARKEDGFDHSPFAVWWLDGKVEEQFAGLASGIRDALNNASDWKVADKLGDLRGLKTGDIAVLCRSHVDVARMAKSLGELGIPVAVERTGLARTVHVELVMAAFRWVSDPTDSLALAELARFFDDDPQSDGWLKAIASEGRFDALAAIIPITAALRNLRENLLALTPSELVDAIILLPDVMRQIEAWGDATIRLDDLEALRGFARAFEALCVSSGVAATPSGLILALGADDPPRPKSLKSAAVKIMTYHGAKGLEWPMVILTGLTREPKPRLHMPVAQADGAIDWRNPLSDRWIRYWPWPYGAASKDVHLDVTAPASAIGMEAKEKARFEEVRLLYVGLTRARDYVVFAPPTSGDLNWLRTLDTTKPGHISLPKAPGNTISIGSKTFAARVSPMITDELVTTKVTEPSYVRVDRPSLSRLPLRRRPSMELSDDDFDVIERQELGSRLPLTGTPDMQLLGDAVHAILAADVLDEDPGLRLKRADAILDRWKVREVKAGDILLASDRLHSYLKEKMPSAKHYREAPISAHLGSQLISGRIDLLLDDGDTFAVIDHKSFPGSRDKWETRAISYGSQLDLYAEALASATGRSQTKLFVHMPIVGVILELRRRKVAAAM